MDLWFGFGVALQPHNLMWSFFGVLVGNLIGVLPGMRPISAIAMLLPLAYTMHLVPAILMLAGIFYGSQYGGAIGAILLNLPCHPPHAVTCLGGYPLTKQGKAGTALGITSPEASSHSKSQVDFIPTMSLGIPGEVLAFGLAGALLAALDFPAAPILLGCVLGPMVEENFRRTLLLSRGDMMVPLERPISAAFMSVSALLILTQLFFWLRSILRDSLRRKEARLRLQDS